ncbi:MAG: hypothetical protein JEZ02_09240 [Desulfatibacillum sp.]|nr:hypothetical protein [Desulfatibacillum sp.]
MSTARVTFQERHGPGPASEHEIRPRLQWLMLLRVVFTTLLLGATIVVQWQDPPQTTTPPLLVLYGIIAGTYLLTFLYGLLFTAIPLHAFSYLQLALDTILVTFIIYVTGGYSSVFSFLYLVIIIYSSLFLQRNGTVVIAALCSIQYGLTIDLEYFGLLDAFDQGAGISSGLVPWNQIVFKIIMTTVACFLVAGLSSLLSEQEYKTRQELRSVRQHMQRVEKMAAVGEMAARLTHEIKNPLAALVGSVRLLQDDLALEGTNERLMRIILREADRLGGLVNEFLQFARPVPKNPTPICLATHLTEIVELFRRDRLATDRLTVTTQLNPMHWIEMDSSHFRQVIWNFLLNSAQAIESQGHVRIITEITNNDTVAIRVIDDGSGIDETTMKSLFEPFFTTKSQGSGLGLCVVYRILEAYGFLLDVDSAPGQGSTFSILARRAFPPATDDK